VTRAPKLVVLGNACRDVIFRVPAFPRPGETLVAEDLTADLGGKGLNQAIAAHRVGIEVQLIAPIGTDETAIQIRRALAHEGMSLQGLLEHDGTSDTSMIMVGPSGENAIVSDTRLIRGLSPTRAVELVSQAQPTALLIQGNARPETTRALAKLCRAAGVQVVLNAAPLHANLPSLARDLDVVVVNQIEAAAWTGRDGAEDAARSIGSELAIVTLGSGGCLLSLRGGTPLRLPAPHVESMDTTGAGDVFVGVFVGEFLRAGSMEGAARLAILAASDKVKRSGTISAFPSRVDIAAMRRYLVART
jgi:ribokinase